METSQTIWTPRKQAKFRGRQTNCRGYDFTGCGVSEIEPALYVAAIAGLGVDSAKEVSRKPSSETSRQGCRGWGCLSHTVMFFTSAAGARLQNRVRATRHDCCQGIAANTCPSRKPRSGDVSAPAMQWQRRARVVSQPPMKLELEALHSPLMMPNCSAATEDPSNMPWPPPGCLGPRQECRN